MTRRIVLLALTVSLVLSHWVAAQGQSGDLSFEGWIWAEYGRGDRYPESQGEDRLGFSEAALRAKYRNQNFEAVLLLGGVFFTGDDPGNIDFNVQDAFVVWHEIGGGRFSLRAGAQPLLFGLKPEGFPGDRSLQPSLEYGGAGGFAVSQQAGPSIVLSYDLGDIGEFTAGAFDTSASTADYFRRTGLGGIEGSSLEKNYFGQLRIDRLGVDGLYGVVGWEQRYVGDSVNSSEPIFDVGLGYGNDFFDLSLELIDLDETITGTADSDTYTIAELTITPNEDLTLWADFGQSDESDLETIRVGVKVQILQPAAVHFEYSQDKLGAGSDDVHSFDVRLALNF